MESETPIRCKNWWKKQIALKIKQCGLPKQQKLERVIFYCTKDKPVAWL